MSLRWREGATTTEWRGGSRHGRPASAAGIPAATAASAVRVGGIRRGYNAGFQNHFWRHPLILEGMPPLAAGMPAAAGGGFRRRLPRCRRRLVRGVVGGCRPAEAASGRHPRLPGGIRAVSAASGRHPRLPGGIRGFRAASAASRRLPGGIRAARAASKPEAVVGPGGCQTRRCRRHPSAAATASGGGCRAAAAASALPRHSERKR